jgi:hypothetical protein
MVFYVSTDVTAHDRIKKKKLTVDAQGIRTCCRLFYDPSNLKQRSNRNQTSEVEKTR